MKVKVHGKDGIFPNYFPKTFVLGAVPKVGSYFAIWRDGVEHGFRVTKIISSKGIGKHRVAEIEVAQCPTNYS